MGGYGSGRRRESWSKETTESYRRLDIRQLKREGLLIPGAHRCITSARYGGTTFMIDVTAEPGRLILRYRRTSGDDDWEEASHPVYLTTTPCHMGGARHWFRCPVAGCDRRVAVLYGRVVFTCRTCRELAYPSQRESTLDRITRRNNHIRRKLGWPVGISNGNNLGKPKGMHWRTYERLCHEHDRLMQQILSGLVTDLERLTGRKFQPGPERV